MAEITVDALRALDLFAGLTDAQLEWILGHSSVEAHASGAHTFEDDEPAEAMYVVLEGGLSIFYDLGGQYLFIMTFPPGGVTGVLPFSRMTEYGVRGIATGDSRVLRMGREHFPELLRVSPELGQRLVGLMSDRVREATRMQQQREKMMALGKLSAGLAHELNNPASAVARAAGALHARLDDLPSLVARLARHDLSEALLCEADRLRTRARERGVERLGALERGDREDAVGAWLESRAIADPWALAPALVDAGLGPADLEPLAGDLAADAFGDVLRWVAGGIEADRLLGEIASASRRVSDLVASVKSYSHMDRSPETRPTDVHAGLDSTLTMLAHKVKRRSARLERAYDPALPEIEAQAGMLNQVWTNLLDNAFDAIGEGGLVRIETARDGDGVQVRIVDDGPGIPKEIQSRVFEPFFTTKAVGEGTGLGLDMVQRIVRVHQGQVGLDSRPGRTAFTVWLPLAPRARATHEPSPPGAPGPDRG